jgi:membrane associated rhomboid family serine protease
MQFFRRIPATLILITVNIIVFAISYITAGSFDEPVWTLSLLKMGAEFNPYTLDKEWYRIFTHMFLHGNIPHLAFNMYALFSVGSEVESMTGTKKMLWVYFVSGIAAALSSLFFSLFAIGVGASGAIFGLFGFALIINLFVSRKEGRSMSPILINFAVFLGINLLMAKAVNADNAAHFGGLAAGIIIAIASPLTGSAFSKVRIEYALLPVLAVVYFALPRYQVTYFKFFQKIMAVEDSSQNIFEKEHSDEEYLDAFKKNIMAWDTALLMLDAHNYLPSALAKDTFNLRRYIGLRKQESSYRVKMIERESYTYLDSIAYIQDSVKTFLSLDHKLALRPAPSRPDTASQAPPEFTRILYDSNWVEIASPPAAFYRIGIRDSLGLWQGRVQDFYINGDVQMKGTYKDSKRDGIFLYYSDHKTYTSAGRYKNDRNIGKWETFHDNGRMASEVFYGDGYFLKNLWDTSGYQLVKDGFGKEIQHYPNGVVAIAGEYADGNKHGYWYGRHANGEMYFEENYNRGRLVNGRSRSMNGEIFNYDESSLFSLPEGGYKKFNNYLRSATTKVNANVKGMVRLSFRVTTAKVLTDFKIEKSLNAELDEKAKEILLNGPEWMPARLHGHQPVDGFAIVTVEFN